MRENSNQRSEGERLSAAPHLGWVGLVVEQDEPSDPLNIGRIMLDTSGLDM